MTTMYSLRPIIHHDELPERSSDCMYEMKNIHRNGHTRQDCRIDSNVTSQVINYLKSPLPEVKALETRQEKILVQLTELKAQVLSLCDVLKSNENPKSPRKSKREPVTADFVVNVNPESPAYSLLALKKLWSDVDFRIEPFQHSSVQGVIPEGFGRTRGCGESVISISLIWKKVNNAELVLSSLHESRILGEVNLLRYLSRLLDNHDSLPPEEATKIDGILDLSHQLVSQDNLKIKLSIINILDKKITNGNWFSTRKTPGIGDVAVWSALKQISPKSLPSNLASWYQKCEKSLNA